MAEFGYDPDQWGNSYLLVRIGHDLGAPYLAIQAALCAGLGENNLHTYGCNQGGYCGLWQVGAYWQQRRRYTDTDYWTHFAYQNGFYGMGGLIDLARNHSNENAGWIANACQGAFADLGQGASYYGRYEVAANQLYNYWWPRVAGTSGGGGGGGGGGTPDHYVKLGRTNGQIYQIDDGIDITLDSDVVAIADGHVLTPASDSWPGWGPYMALSIDSGSKAGWRYYVAEGLAPVVIQGDSVRAGQLIAYRRTNQGNGVLGSIEAGWAGFNDPSRTLAQERGHGGMKPSPEGSDFANWYVSGMVADAGTSVIAAEAQTAAEAILADDWSPWLKYGADNMHARALVGYLYSQKALADCQSINYFTTTGGKW